MARAKKLNSGVILSAKNKMFTKKKLTLTIDNKDYEVLIDEKFSGSKLQNMVIELAEKQKYMHDINQVIEIPNYIIFLIIKYFTDIDVAKVDSFEEQIRVFSAMVDIDIVEPILQTFDETEMKKIDVYVKRLSNRVNKLNKEIEDSPEVKEELDRILVEIESLKNKEDEPPLVEVGD